MDIGTLLGRGWQRLSSDMATCILVFLVGLILVAISGITLGIVGIPIMAGMYKTFRSVARGGKGDFNDLFSEFSNMGYWFGLWLFCLVVFIIAIIPLAILGAIPFLGQLVSLAIGVVGGYLLWFAFPLMIERRIPALEACKESFAVTKANMGTLFGVYIVAYLVYMAGSLVVIGTLVTGPLMYIINWLAYDQFYGLSGATDSGMAPPPATTYTDVPPPPPSDTTL
jgi:hypothetical protein